MSSISSERQEIIEDIQYLESLIDVEKKDIKNGIKKRLQGKQGLEQQVDTIVEELSYVLGQISARVAVVEKSLVNSGDLQNAERKPIYSERDANGNSNSMAFSDEVKLSIVDIGERNHLGYLQHTNSNMPYHTLSPNSSITFELQINRASKKTLAVNIAEVSDKSLLDNVVIKVDGVTLKHKQAVVNEQLRLLSYIPSSKNLTSATHVEIIIPNNTAANQPFKFCLSDVHCVNKATLIGMAKKLFN